MSFTLPLLFLRGRGLRVMLAVVALGVASGSVCAIELVNRAVAKAFTEVLEGVVGRATLHVTAGDGGLFPEAVAGTIADVPGVEYVVPVLSATAPPADGSGPVVSVLGVNVAQASLLGLYDVNASAFLANPVPLARADTVMVTRPLAVRHAIDLGAQIALETPRGRRSFLVGGILEPRAAGRIGGGELVVMHLFAAQALFARAGLINRVDVLADPAADATELEDAIAAHVPAGLQVGASAQRRLDSARTIGTLRTVLRGVAVAGVVLGFLVAFNNLSTHFEARGWEAAMMRAAGVRRMAVWRELMKEGALLGAAGGLVGLPLGIGLARVALPRIAATAALNANQAQPAADLAVEPPVLLIALGVSLGAAALAATLPARRAAQVNVAEALRSRRLDEPIRPLGWLLRGLVAAGIGAGIVGQAVSGSAVYGLVASGLLVVGTALAARPLVHGARGVLASILDRLAGPSGPFACAAIVGNVRRSALTAATIGVGLGSVLWIATLAESFERSLARVLGATLRAELVVSSPRLASGWVPVPIDDGVLQELTDVPGVVGVAGNRIDDWLHQGRRVALNAFDPAYFRDSLFGRPSLSEGAPADVWERVARGEAAIVSTNFAYTFHARVGDPLVLDSPSGPVELRIAGIATAFMSPNGTIEFSREVHARAWRDRLVNRVWVRTDPSADPVATREAIERRLGRERQLQVLPADEVRDQLVSQVRRAFAPLGIVRGVVLLVVLLGMADTLAAGVAARVREVGAVRAVGVRRQHVLRMVLAEGAMLGILGFILACGAGLALGLLWVRATLPALLGWVVDLHVPYRHMAADAMATVAVCLAAALLPARAASRIQPAAALRYD